MADSNVVVSAQAATTAEDDTDSVTANAELDTVETETVDGEDSVIEPSETGSLYSNILDWRVWQPGPWNRFARYESKVAKIKDRYTEKVSSHRRNFAKQ